MAAVQRQAKDEATAFVAILRACAKNKDIFRGTRVHDDILRRGLLKECSDALVTMYAKCGAVVKAKDLFDRHKGRDVFTWTALIAGFAQKSQGQNALKYFKQMQDEGLSPDAVTFTCILKACGSTGAVDMGERIHDDIAKQNLLENNVVLGTSLVDMYAKCGALEKARQVLEQLPGRNVVSWNALIAGYAQQGKGAEAISCFDSMKQEGIPPNAVTFLCVLKACGSIKAADEGGKIHDEIVKQGLLGDKIALGNALIDMYAKCRDLSKARRVLEELSTRDVISWNSLISGYAEQGQGEQALSCFEQMQREGICPDAVTFSSILRACGSIGALGKGEKIHDEITKQGFLGNNIVLGTALVDMYAKCGALAKARRVLEELPRRNVISWTALISGYAQQGESEEALVCFERMESEGFSPNEVTISCILKVCGSIRAAVKGRKVHEKIAKQGLLWKNLVVGNALVDMYIKCGAVSKARELLNELPARDVVSWNALIAGYAEDCQGEQALCCFEQMQKEGVSPDVVTYTNVLKACGSIGAADKGEKIHHAISKQGLLANDILLGTALVDMYANCGALLKAQRVLEVLPVRDAILWNGLIAGYVHQCESKRALDCFAKMEHEGLAPNAATFSSVLSACSRLGLLEDARSLLVNMSSKYGIEPDLEHYTCIVDLLGRAGAFEKALGVIEQIPSSNSGVWSATLSACRKWGDVHVGRWAFEHAVQVDKTDAAVYVLMANIYASAGMQEEAEKIEAMRKENEAWTKPVQTRWIDASGRVHSFHVGDTKSVESTCISERLEHLAQELLLEKHSEVVPRNILSDVKSVLLSGHCEKLALAWALINTHEGERVQIVHTHHLSQK